jgi:hypothetical protein
MHDLDMHLNDDWSWANSEDIYSYRHIIDPMLEEWSIIGLEDGKVDG